MILTIKRLRATINIPKQVQEKKKIRWEFNKKKKMANGKCPIGRINTVVYISVLGASCQLEGSLHTFKFKGIKKKYQSSDRQARQFLLNYIVIRTATWLCSNTYVGDAKISQGGWLRCKHAILYKERKRERTHTNTHTKKHKTRGNLFLKREEEPEGTEAKKKREIR